jgi:hypothetical protein
MVFHRRLTDLSRPQRSVDHLDPHREVSFSLGVNRPDTVALCLAMGECQAENKVNSVSFSPQSMHLKTPGKYLIVAMFLPTHTNLWLSLIIN